jgi:hypothetical protein
MQLTAAASNQWHDMVGPRPWVKADQSQGAGASLPILANSMKLGGLRAGDFKGDRAAAIYPQISHASREYGHEAEFFSHGPGNGCCHRLDDSDSSCRATGRVEASAGACAGRRRIPAPRRKAGRECGGAHQSCACRRRCEGTTCGKGLPRFWQRPDRLVAQHRGDNARSALSESARERRLVLRRSSRHQPPRTRL